MPTFLEKLPPRKASPNSAVEWTPGTLPGSGLLRIGTKRATVEYLVAEFAADGGRGFRLVKCAEGTDREAEGYDVFACGKSAAGDKCECKGFLFVGHCKHADAIRAVIVNGWL